MTLRHKACIPSEKLNLRIQSVKEHSIRPRSWILIPVTRPACGSPGRIPQRLTEDSQGLIEGSLSRATKCIRRALQAAQPIGPEE